MKYVRGFNLTFAIWERSNDPEHPATSQNKPEQPGTSKNHVEYSRTIRKKGIAKLSSGSGPKTFCEINPFLLLK